MNALIFGALFALLPSDGLQPDERISVRWSLLMNLSQQDRQMMTTGVRAALQTWRARPRFDEIEADCLSRPACVTTSFMRAGAEEEWMLSVVRLGEDVRVEGVRTRSLDGRISSTSIAPFVVARTELDQPDAWIAPAPTPELTLSPEATAQTAPTRRPVPPGTWIATGVAAAALGIGIGFGVSAANLESGLEADGCASRPCGSDRIDRLDDHAAVADISYGVAGAAAVTAVVLFFLRPTNLEVE